MRTMAEASELGLRPGAWPTTLEVQDRNGIVAYKRGDAVRDREGELQAFLYHAPGRSPLTVVND